MSYTLEGRLLETCSCHGPCPCWVGEEPDGGKCDGLVAFHYDRGQITGIDVSGLTIGMLALIPGRAIDGNWKVAVFVDDKATPQQKEAILAAHTGQLGGPLADLAQVVGEVVGVYDAPIEFDVRKGTGAFRIGEVSRVQMQPFMLAPDRPIQMYDAVLNTPGLPAYLGKASEYEVRVPQHGMEWQYNGRNSIQSEFRYEG